MITLAMLLVVTASIYSYFYNQRNRQINFQQFASQMNFEYMAEPDIVEGQKILCNSLIFSGRTQGSNFQDLIRGERSGYQFRLIRSRFFGGREADVQTIICIDIKSPKFSPFSIQNKIPFCFSDALVGKKRITVQRPKDIFLKHIILVDEDVGSYIDLPKEFVQFFIDFPEFNCEFLPGRLLVYRPLLEIQADQISKWLDHAIHLAVVLEQV